VAGAGAEAAGRAMYAAWAWDRRGSKPGDRGRQCAALRRMQPRPTRRSVCDGWDLPRRNGCVWRVMTKKTSAPRPAEGIPARQVGACHNALLSPGPQCVTTELTQAEKCGLLMVKLQSPLPTLFSPRVSAVHSGRVFRTALPDNNRKLPCSDQRLRDLRELTCVSSNGVFGIDLLRPRLKHRLSSMSQRSLVISLCTRKLRPSI
jgi:hypothetical protein